MRITPYLPRTRLSRFAAEIGQVRLPQRSSFPARFRSDSSDPFSAGGGGGLVQLSLKLDFEQRVAQQLNEWGITNIPKETAASADKLASFSCNYRDQTQINNYRDLLFAAADSHEALLLLAARDLTALRLMSSQNVEERIVLRAFNVTAGLLEFLQQGEEAGELADLALLYLAPEKYQAAARLLEKSSGLSRSGSLKKLQEISGELGELINILEVPFESKLRVKRAASAAAKLAQKGEVVDINALRFILKNDDPAACYDVIQHIREYLLSRSWREEEDRYDDYIATPKENSYQSLHAAFRDPSGYPLEVQVRTAAMDWAAEFGKASHYSYKAGKEQNDDFLSSAADLFAARQRNLGREGKYFVYDQDGTLYKMTTNRPDTPPTVLDFAFAKGIFYGLKTAGGQVNGAAAPIDRPLASGDTVNVKISQEELAASRRINKAKTPIAQIILKAASLGTLDPSQPLDSSGLIRKGKEEFALIQADTKDGMASDRTELFFSMERVVNRLGFRDEQELFLIMGLLRDLKQKEFNQLISKTIGQNAIFLLPPAPNRLEIMVRDLPGVSLEAVKLIAGLQLPFAGLAVKPLGRSALSLIEIKLAVEKLTCKKLDQLKAALADLYRDLPPPPLDPFGPVKELEIRFASGQLNAADCLEVLAAICKAGINIKEAEVPSSSGKAECYLKFKLQLPTGQKGRKAAKALVQILGQIKKVRTVTVL